MFLKKLPIIASIIGIGIILLGGLFFYWDKYVLNQSIDSVSQTWGPNNSASPNRSPAKTLTPTPVQTTPSSSPSATPTEKSVLLNALFAAQAPFGEWSNPIFQNGCEEASILVAISWVNGIKFLAKDEIKNSIIAITDFEDRTYGYAPDRSAADTAKLLTDYFDYQKVSVKYGVSAYDIKYQLQQGNLVIVPVNGQVLKNPFYTPPGPERHMLVIIGYDAKTKEFITQDVGTRHGEKFRYSENILSSALRDYLTGDHLPVTENIKAMIVVQPR